MKNLFRFAFILLMGMGQLACEGPEGPEGPAGPEGAPGVQGPAGTNAAKAAVYEYGDFTFNAANQYQDGLDFESNDIEVTEGDVLLVYRAYGATQNQKIIWSPLPYTVMFPQGLMKYDFLHTDEAVVVYLTAQFDRSALGTQWTTDQVFRFVIVPGAIQNGRKAGVNPNIDFNNYEEVAKYYNIAEGDVVKIRR